MMSFLLLPLNSQSIHLIERPAMKVEIEKFGDGRSLKVLVRFEKAPNFWIEDLTWVPKIDEVRHVLDVLLAIDDANKIKRAMTIQKTCGGGKS
jgi:hypothetical protein